MVTNYQYAVFSLDVYQDAEESVTLPGDWSVYKTSDDLGFSNGGYFGIAYINNTTNEVVIAHRGTELSDIGDLLNDVQVSLGFVPSQYTNGAKPFTEAIGNDLLGHEITHTGHSLGGILAEISAYQNKTSAISFDSPGSKPILERLVGGEIVNTYNDITTFNSAPNFINATNDHIGNIVRVFPEFEIQGTFNNETSYFTYALDYTANNQHKMSSILETFNENTGQPYVKALIDNDLWPSDPYESFFLSYDSNPHYWEKYFSFANLSEQERIDFIDNNLGGISDNVVDGINIMGDVTNNFIWGTTNGQDVVSSSAGKDLIISYGGDDKVFAALGNDIVLGGNGDDSIFGGLGNDILIGGQGADNIYTGLGNDIIKYNFISESDSINTDIIHDFKKGKDTIDLSNLFNEGIDDFSDLTIANGGGSTTISANNSDFEIQLTGDIQLESSDFIF